MMMIASLGSTSPLVVAHMYVYVRDDAAMRISVGGSCCVSFVCYVKGIMLGDDDDDDDDDDAVERFTNNPLLYITTEPKPTHDRAGKEARCCRWVA